MTTLVIMQSNMEKRKTKSAQNMKRYLCKYASLSPITFYYKINTNSLQLSIATPQISHIGNGFVDINILFLVSNLIINVCIYNMYHHVRLIL